MKCSICPATAVKFYNVGETNDGISEWFGRGTNFMSRCAVHVIRDIENYDWITEMTPEEAMCAAVLFE